MLDALKDAARRVVGARQVLRAIAAGEVAHAYLPAVVQHGADPFVTRPVVDACEKSGVRYTEIETMAQLGAACGIDVRASVAGALKEARRDNV